MDEGEEGGRVMEEGDDDSVAIVKGRGEVYAEGGLRERKWE